MHLPPILKEGRKGAKQTQGCEAGGAGKYKGGHLSYLRISSYERHIYVYVGMSLCNSDFQSSLRQKLSVLFLAIFSLGHHESC